MATLRLTRVSTGEEGTFGVLTIDGEPLCVTLEPPKNGNEQEISCIPEGMYQCFHYNSDEYGDTICVANVHNRFGIIVHYGNTVKNTKGCILTGNSFGKINDKNAVMNSQKAYYEFQRRIKDIKDIKLVIEECY